MSNDEEHLKLLSIFHYILGGLGALFACMPLIHVTIGIVVLVSPDAIHERGDSLPPELMGWFLVVIGSTIFLVGQSVAIAIIFSGRCLSTKRNYSYSFIIGCVECMFLPLGTVLGVFTIVVLSRETVKELYQKGPI